MKRKNKWYMLLFSICLLGAFAFAGCENGQNGNGADQNSSQSSEGNTSGTENHNGNDIGEDGAAAGGAGDQMTGPDANNSENGNDANNSNLINDVTDGSNSIASDGFDCYEDARDYIFGQFSNRDQNAKYEFRNESKDEIAYDDSDQNKKGYQYEIYDTSSGEKGNRIGIFYVDKETGKIYHKNADTNKLEEYKW